MTDPGTPPDVPTPPTTSGKAIASLILGLFSFCTVVTGILGILFGLLGLRDINRSQGRVSGKGLAISGLILSILGMLFVAGVTILVNQGIQTSGQVRAKSEINELDRAIREFQAQYQVNYLPSKLSLNNPRDMASNQFLARMFRRYDKNKLYRWNGRDTSPVTLEGHECLVFFLGGIPKQGDPPSCQGFSTNPADPTDFTFTKDRIAPLFEFNSTQLRVGPKGFLYYLDTYKQAPYAYFSPSGTSNGYNPDDCSGIGSLGHDCGTVKPYFKNPNQYLEPDGWQIISAGADGKFGPGGVVWGPAHPVKADTPGADDVANFSPLWLGKP